MSSELIAWQPSAADADTAVSGRVLSRIAGSVPESTRRAYAKDWLQFSSWCDLTGRTALPCTAETLAEYSSALADQDKAPATIMRAMSSIRVIHKLNGQPPPETLAARAVVKTYRNERAASGRRNSSPAVALSVKHLKAVAGSLDAEQGAIAQLRDRLIFVLGWAMMARRSDLTRLDIPDVREVEQGLEVTVRRSKADQMAEGRIVGVPYGSDPLTCPVRLVRAWLAVLAERGITSGPLLRRIDRHGRIAGEPGTRSAGRQADTRLTGKGVWHIVRRSALAAGIPIEGIKAHSLRAGGVTGAYLAGADLLSIGRHGGWHDGSPVLLRYVRDVDRWKKNPMHGAGL